MYLKEEDDWKNGGHMEKNVYFLSLRFCILSVLLRLMEEEIFKAHGILSDMETMCDKPQC